MFRPYFRKQDWACWSWSGTAIIISVTWYQVHLDVQINEWFGEFYNVVQKGLQKPGSISEAEFNKQLFSFVWIAMIYIVVSVVAGFFTKHWTFRWRQAMTDHYMRHWPRLRRIEGASQRIQEDTRRFASIVESLGASLLDAVMTLIAFVPILWELSKSVKMMPLLGKVDHGLVWLTVLWALVGTVALSLIGIRLPGLEFNNQLVEAAYRKELVYGEDNEDRAAPKVVEELFAHVRENYFRLFLNFMYFDVAKYSYLQFGVIVPYFALGPTITGAGITLGSMQQLVRAFGRVESSFQFLVRSWTTIVELISIYQRLRDFGAAIQKNEEGVGPESERLKYGKSWELENVAEAV